MAGLLLLSHCEALLLVVTNNSFSDQMALLPDYEVRSRWPYRCRSSIGL